MNLKTSIPITALVAVVGVLVFAGCTEQPIGIVDCGNDIVCFEERAQTCSLAKVSFTLSDALRQTGLEDMIDQLGMDMRFYEEIKGGTAENCTFYARIDELIFPGIGELTQEEQMSLNFMKGMLEGRDMTCYLPLTQITGAMSIFGETPGFNVTEHCTGSLLELQASVTGGL